MGNIHERFWTGPIRTKSHADKIIRLTSGTFAVIAILMALTMFRGASTGGIVGIFVFGAVALAIRRTGSSVLLMIATAVTALVPLLAVGGAIYTYWGGDKSLAIPIGVIGALWALLPLACFRATQAALFLREQTRASA